MENRQAGSPRVRPGQADRVCYGSIELLKRAHFQTRASASEISAMCVRTHVKRNSPDTYLNLYNFADDAELSWQRTSNGAATMARRRDSPHLEHF
jgi:hypothetical protein